MGSGLMGSLVTFPPKGTMSISIETESLDSPMTRFFKTSHSNAAKRLRLRLS